MRRILHCTGRCYDLGVAVSERLISSAEVTRRILQFEFYRKTTTGEFYKLFGELRTTENEVAVHEYFLRILSSNLKQIW